MTISDEKPIAYLRDVGSADDPCYVPAANGDPGAFPVYRSTLRSQLDALTAEPSSDLVKRLEDEGERLSGHSIDRGSVDAGIASNLACEAAAALIAAEAQLARQGEALKEIASFTQTEKLLWWQVRAREALEPLI